ncbi:MlaC/ttg2D family ABC transporter substrate-binding protein [Xanthomonas graminis]|uniref:MlaC/ttg2D family ABC transporter substrate-binding protein n=1 Tax=Xanthomonas graminis TaxID=3390026 RepID=UPI001F47B369|nr:ABC transporter substrate-binding protein [Xanthomonas translucens]UKE73125.1 ABC transporter substrate-binding protein [Xanthomonas translucens pv. phleipratensis]
MTNRLLSAALAAALAAAAPAIALAQAAPAAAAAQQGSASKVVLDNSTRILATLEQRRAEFKNNNAALKKFIDSEMDTSFDRDYAARLVLGVHGRGASDADVKLFADAMADNLMQRYGTSLLTFEGKPQVRVKSETPLPGGRGAKVSTELLRSGGDPIPVDYLLRNNGGSWKIFDVMVEGVSYVQTFRNQFDTPLRTKSIPQVAADLRNGAMQVAPASTSGK